ncbi:MAG: hypothetical protein ACFCU7_18795, partial [Pleurocapsa sp.]
SSPQGVKTLSIPMATFSHLTPMGYHYCPYLIGILFTCKSLTSIHYTDNAIYVHNYPEPEWFTTSGVFITWGVMTAIAFISYWLYNQQLYWLSYFLLGMYAGTGLSSPAHYFGVAD